MGLNIPIHYWLPNTIAINKFRTVVVAAISFVFGSETVTSGAVVTIDALAAIATFVFSRLTSFRDIKKNEIIISCSGRI